jgi:ABC-type uncharacterized transport system ATPase subunit
VTQVEFALELQGIRKQFGDTLALHDASLAVRPGTVHMLLGENGAGKTTLLNVATGLTRPDTGTIHLRGESRRWNSAHEAIAHGVVAVHQHFALVPTLSVAENVALTHRTLLAPFTPASAADFVRTTATAAGLDIDPYATVGTLPIALQQRVEIVKAIATAPSVLLLDEPTAVLSAPEAEDLFRWLRGFAAAGHAVVVITHRLREALAHGDHITVLRQGRVELDAPGRALSADDVLTAVAGDTMSSVRDTRAAHDAVSASSAAVVLDATECSWIDSRGLRRLAGVNLSVRAGEIVGIAGVAGAGQWELLRILAGRLVPSGGTVVGPDDVAFIPEDRLRDAVIEDLSLVENMTLRNIGTRAGLVPWAAEAQRTTAAIAAYAIRAPGAHARMAGLSGGNQQRFVVAREMAGGPRAIVAENPTRGLDIRASQFVREQLRAARATGAAVVVYSSDVDELLDLADRIAVCHAGRLSFVASDPAAIAAAMLGAA